MDQDGLKIMVLNKRTVCEKQCPVCGETFHPLLSEVRRGRGRFCSKKCRNINQTGRKLNMSPEAKRKKVAKWRETMDRNGSWLIGAKNHKHKPVFTMNGYEWLSDGNGEKKATHRAVMEKKIGRPLTKTEIVHHKNGNKRDNRPSNLEIVTRGEHLELHYDEVTKNIKRSLGSKNKTSKLTENAVVDIRNSADSLVSLAAKYGVSTTAIRYAKIGMTWKHV